MATSVASRFAVLTIDDEADDPYSRRRQKKKVEADPTKAKTGSASQQSKQAAADPKKKKKNPKKTENTNQAQNNGPAKPKKAANGTQKAGGQSKPAKKPAGQSEEQWEEWKKKDQEFVSDAYESDILQAVLQSKLEYEQRSKVVITSGADDPPGGKGSRKRSKPQTMSLEQFNNPLKEQQDLEEAKEKEDEDEEEVNRLFFAQVNEDARRAISHEMLQEQTRVRQAYVQEAVTISQFQNILEKRDIEIDSLKDEVNKLRNELKDVRARNSKLCTILAQGEMKDKVGALLEVERLQTERNELVSEVQNLSTQLEQERSKVHALSSSMDKKNKGKKKTSSESADK